MEITIQFPIFDGRQLFNVKEVERETSSWGNAMYAINGLSKNSFLNKIGSRMEVQTEKQNATFYSARRAIRLPKIENSIVKLGGSSFSPQVGSRMLISEKKIESYFEISFFYHIHKLYTGQIDIVKLVKDSFLNTCLSIQNAVPSTSKSFNCQTIRESKNRLKDLYYYATTPKSRYAMLFKKGEKMGKHYRLICSDYIVAGVPVAILETKISQGYCYDSKSLVCVIGRKFPIRIHQLTSNDSFVSWLIAYEDQSCKNTVKQIKDYILFAHRFNECRRALCKLTRGRRPDLYNVQIRNTILKLIDSKLATDSYFNSSGNLKAAQDFILSKILFTTKKSVDEMVESIKQLENEFNGLNIFERLLKKNFYITLLSSFKDKPHLFNSVITIEEIVKSLNKGDFERIRDLSSTEVEFVKKAVETLISYPLQQPAS